MNVEEGHLLRGVVSRSILSTLILLASLPATLAGQGTANTWVVVAPGGPDSRGWVDSHQNINRLDLNLFLQDTDFNECEYVNDGPLFANQGFAQMASICFNDAFRGGPRVESVRGAVGVNGSLRCTLSSATAYRQATARQRIPAGRVFRCS